MALTTSSLDSNTAQFLAQGYCVMRGLCAPDRVAQMKRCALRDLSESVDPVEYEADVGYAGAPRSLEQPGGRTIRRLLGALKRDPVFLDWARSDALLRVIRVLLRGLESDADGFDPTATIRVVQAHHNCIMTKQPDYSSSTGWHQDTRYWSFQRPDLINVWTALGRESADNGGMRLIPGSHRQAFDEASF
ncbi:MAG: phytanoyl-CoA dioxygenase family protein, partial [Pseudomonadota bacterium]